jgi:acetylglutamate kinase
MTSTKELPLLLFKYGGNAMRSADMQEAVIQAICQLKSEGAQIILVHGGGPFIQKMLDIGSVESEFIEGHRKTSPEALKYVKMALKGQVNLDLVSLINKNGQTAVGLSGIDGKMVQATKRFHQQTINGQTRAIDLGQVGDVETVDTRLIRTLLAQNIIPVVTCVAADENGNEYNINADMFAGHLAGALGVDQFVVLTDVDGLMEDVKDPDSLYTQLAVTDLKDLHQRNIIKGGMIPKVESCKIALEEGAHSARILNGTKPEQFIATLRGEEVGTEITA